MPEKPPHAVMVRPQNNGHMEQYPEEVVDRALLLTVLNGGNVAAAVRSLNAEGIAVTTSTLQRWKNNLPDRYRFHMTENGRLIEQRIVEEQRELAAMATAGARLAVETELERLEAGQVKDAAQSAKNLATVMGITTTKILELTGRPTQVVEHRKPEDVVNRLTAIIDSTAEDDTEAA